MDEIWVYPKRDIMDIFKDAILNGKESYRCRKILDIINAINGGEDEYVIECELIGGTFPIMKMSEILENFDTIEEMRDSKIENILK